MSNTKVCINLLAIQLLFRNLNVNFNKKEARAFCYLGLVNDYYFTQLSLSKISAIPLNEINIYFRIFEITGLIIKHGYNQYFITKTGNSLLDQLVINAGLVSETGKVINKLAVDIPILEKKLFIVKKTAIECPVPLFRDMEFPFIVKGIPQNVVLIAQKIVKQLKEGLSYGRLGGRTLRENKSIVSIPVGRRYRLLCLKLSNGNLDVKKLISHEAYNKSHNRLII